MQETSNDMNKLVTDKQTILDLNIFPKLKDESSIFDLYNKTETKGGKAELENILRSPLNNKKEIDERLSTIKFIIDNRISYKLDKQGLDFIEYYLNQNTPILRDNIADSTIKWFSDKIKPSNEYYIISKGLECLKNHLILLTKTLEKHQTPNTPILFQELYVAVKGIFNSLDQQIITSNKAFSPRQINYLDALLRGQYKGNIQYIIKLTYLLDVYLSVAKVTLEQEFCFPETTSSLEPHLNVKGFFHPLIKEPVKNDLELIGIKNLCFVTGANMSGKSTFLKTMGLCVYLSHVGFPVPADYMEISIFNGIYTTINISDDINKGYSHYYSEVKRVKEIVLSIKERNKAFVIFDELFRGTNVKDAYDATLMVSEGFTRIKDSLFFISTHIVEVGQELKRSSSVNFRCFESFLDGEQPVYNYKLTSGISSERMGLTILKNENIMSIIDEITNK